MELSGKLLFNRIAIKLIEVPEKNKRGIFLPESAKSAENIIDRFDDHPFQGEVIGVGEHVTICKKGDIVLLKGDINMPILLDLGTVYQLINETDVILVREQ